MYYWERDTSGDSVLRSQGKSVRGGPPVKNSSKEESTINTRRPSRQYLSFAPEQYLGFSGKAQPFTGPGTSLADYWRTEYLLLTLKVIPLLSIQNQIVETQPVTPWLRTEDKNEGEMQYVTDIQDPCILGTGFLKGTVMM